MKCAVGKCMQNDSQKSCELLCEKLILCVFLIYLNSAITFYSFPKHDEDLKKLWIKFCNRRNTIKTHRERICSLHFKKDDFERNLKYEMGFSNRATLKLKEGAVPTIEVIETEEETTTFVAESKSFLEETTTIPEETTIYQKETITVKTTNNQDSLQIYIKNLEVKMDALRQENDMLKMQKNQAEITIQNLSEEIQKLNFTNANLQKALQRLFTEGQIKKLINGDRRQNFSEADIAQSITLYSTSAKAYRLLKRKNFPLPSVRTLQRWSQKLDVSTGILEPVVKILSAANQMSEAQKLCVLSFDEMKAKKKYCYDKPTDSLLEPANYIQVAMLRGLMAKWKQPIFYSYDCQMTKTILFNIVKTMRQCGFVIVAIVCDLGGGNRKLFNELEVDFKKPWFLYDDTKIFVFSDVPHMIKLLRNHFIDQGFIINGKEVKKDIILNLLSLQSSDLKITHKISAHNLSVAGAERQKVKLATKLFSHTVAQSITRAASLGFLSDKNWSECSHFFKLTNDWFDIMNSKLPRQDTRERLHAYGLSPEIQNETLNNMSQMMLDIRVIGRKTLLPFQKGIIQSNNALKMLHDELKNRYNIEYVLTYRLNQDVLENFFGIIRSKGGLHDHPDRQEFKYRLRSYILGYNEGILGTNANVEVDNTPDLEDVHYSLTGKIFKCINPSIEQDVLPKENYEEELESLNYDGLENLAGYICHKLKNEDTSLAAKPLEDSTYSWVTHLNEGGLSIPSNALMDTLKSCDEIFVKLNGDKLLATKGYLEKHLAEAKNIRGSEEVKRLFFRCRMYFRIRSLNAEMSQNINTRKRKLNKTTT